ncbi:dihydrodipicolinate synthase family protein [Streptomyces sp. TRM 70361]|uniref:dihydrodipicolinate synthase family protein n=1 Tax=Streptomyces sp. TRM 70361 TaxID=3116553 RepID=UPI002E7B20CA|nr:dihydrodipicolinate synthase family protein [Streptomyces sp. TRM 70361]MEE1941593.1 dihydrodipicolinate synthase family protein [Streptomyces sp. TRM 70361]
MTDSPFGRVAAAMITPFTPGGELDLPAARRLAAHLVDRGGCDALVLGGATGESATVSDAERTALVRAVAETAGDRARIVADVGTGGTRRSVELARAAARAGAHGLLAGAPYCASPVQEAAARQLAAVADATDLPVLLLDVPARSGEGTALTADTLRRLAEHPRVHGVLDRAGDLLKPAKVLGSTGLRYYSGRDELNLPLRAIGAHGCVSAAANVAGPAVRGVLDAFDAGDSDEAARRHRALAPLIDALVSEVPEAVAVKALFAAAGLPGGPPRPPLLPADDALTGRLAEALRRALG